MLEKNLGYRYNYIDTMANEMMEFFLFEKNDKITNKSTYLPTPFLRHTRESNGWKTITHESIRLIIHTRLLYVRITPKIRKQFASARYTGTVLFDDDRIEITTTGYTNFKVRFFHFLEKKKREEKKMVDESAG